MIFLDLVCNYCKSALSIPDTASGLPYQLCAIVSMIYTAIKIAVPLILVIVGMIDMAKAMTSKDEAEIKKAQNLLVRKAVTAALVFFIISLVALLFNVISDDGESEDMWSCINAFLNGPSESGCVDRY